MPANGRDSCSVVEGGKRCGKPVVARGWCRKHYTRWDRTGDPLGVRRQRRSPLSWIDKTEGCWYWTGVLRWDGYGLAQRPDGQPGNRVAHIVIYELLVGPVPKGLTLDHECHNQDATCPGGKDCFHRSCVRPDHLVPRTIGDNLFGSKNNPAHRTHCPAGHEYTEDNTLWWRGTRKCRICHAARERARRAAKAG